MSTIVILFLFLVIYSSSRRGNGRGSRELSAASQRRIDELTHDVEMRTDEIDVLSERVAELENRLDFAERLLADKRIPSMVPDSAVGGARRTKPGA